MFLRLTELVVQEIRSSFVQCHALSLDLKSMQELLHAGAEQLWVLYRRLLAERGQGNRLLEQMRSPMLSPSECFVT